MTVEFIDGHRTKFGVEPICAVLSEIDPDNWKVSPSTYYAAKTRPMSERAISDIVMKVAIFTVWQSNYEVYGVRKMWKAMRRSGVDVGRDQVGRLMRDLGIEGARRGKRVRTSRSDEKATRPPDLVNRDFTATGPNQLWVTDLTYVPTWPGMVHVSFITDVFSHTIVGWRVRRTCAPTWCWSRSRWPAGHAVNACRGSCATPMPGRDTRRFATPNASTRSALPLHRQRRGQLRQRPRRDDQPSLQDRADPPARPVARRRPGRAGNPGVGPLVTICG